MENELIKKFQDFIDGDIYKQVNSVNCTNNGASSRFNKLYIVRPYVTLQHVKELVKKYPERYNIEQFFRIDMSFYETHRYIRLEPLTKGGKYCMFGGNYLKSSDSRFKEFVFNLPYPVPIHDRFEYDRFEY